MQRFYQQQLQTMATTATMEMGMGLSRMSDDEYSSEFGTPRPGTREISESDYASESTSRWIFSQLAKLSAQETKRKIVSRTVYRMAANKRVKDALDSLEKAVECGCSAGCSAGCSDEMTQADFQLLKKSIEMFNVKIRMFDSVTVSDLAAMREKAQLAIYHANITPLKERELMQWMNDLTGELRRVNTMRPIGVPSQQAQIMHSSGITLCNVLSPETIRRRFISLKNLTDAIRSDLVIFLTSESRKLDRTAVVNQIKEAIRRKASQ
jgi:hypothetical protein